MNTQRYFFQLLLLTFCMTVITPASYAGRDNDERHGKHHRGHAQGREDRPSHKRHYSPSKTHDKPYQAQRYSPAQQDDRNRKGHSKTQSREGQRYTPVRQDDDHRKGHSKTKSREGQRHQSSQHKEGYGSHGNTKHHKYERHDNSHRGNTQTHKYDGRHDNRYEPKSKRDYQKHKEHRSKARHDHYRARTHDKHWKHHNRHYQKHHWAKEHRRHHRHYRRHETYRYHTHYLAPIRHRYHHIGHHLHVLPSTHVSIFVSGLPYFYFGGVFYRHHDDGYVVVRAPIGAHVRLLPAGFISFYLGGHYYYYVNDTYYIWDDDIEVYRVVSKPVNADNAIAEATEGRLYVYPNQGQSEEQQAKDRYECHRWAVHETGIDPTLEREENDEFSYEDEQKYKRALTACLEGRGYTVK